MVTSPEELSGYKWNGVQLRRGEANGSLRAILTTVAEDRFELHRFVVAACHDACGDRELSTEDLYFEKGTKPVSYLKQRYESLESSDIVSPHEVGRLILFEVTPVAAAQCLTLMENKGYVLPHRDGIY